MQAGQERNSLPACGEAVILLQAGRVTLIKGSLARHVCVGRSKGIEHILLLCLAEFGNTRTFNRSIIAVQEGQQQQQTVRNCVS